MGNGKITRKLKELGLKINGVEPKGDTTSEIIKGIADDYTGGGSGGSSNVFTNTDFYSLVGKHLSVDKLIALLKSKNITEGSSFYILGGVGVVSSNYDGAGPKYGIRFTSGSNTDLNILNKPNIKLTYDTDYETTLLNGKIDIENTIIKNDLLESPVILNNVIENYNSSEYTDTISLQEFLDLFEE